MPGLAAYVRWRALGVSLETRAAASLAGPLAGLLASIACLFVWSNTGDPLWAALARASAWLNILNLIPVWVLVGGQAVGAMNQGERRIFLAGALGLWLILRQNRSSGALRGNLPALYQGLFFRPSRATTVYFLVLRALLGSVMWLIPGPGSGLQWRSGETC